MGEGGLVGWYILYKVYNVIGYEYIIFYGYKITRRRYPRFSGARFPPLGKPPGQDGQRVRGGGGVLGSRD